MEYGTYMIYGTNVLEFVLICFSYLKSINELTGEEGGGVELHPLGEAVLDICCNL